MKKLGIGQSGLNTVNVRAEMVIGEPLRWHLLCEVMRNGVEMRGIAMRQHIDILLMSDDQELFENNGKLPIIFSMGTSFSQFKPNQ